MSIKTQFSIKDLEHLSGIKAHTIRIWESRYNILQPDRTQTNIRYYDLENLMQFLNITYLYKHGYKISKIAKLSPKEIENIVQREGLQHKSELFMLAELKSAMLQFDAQLFEATYKTLEQKYSFREIFYLVFLPFLNDIGLLWQTGTIKPAHEHFMSELIKQKIILQIGNKMSLPPTNFEKIFVLFLPLNEIHEIGLLYIYYELLNKGYKTIFLGNHIPTTNLQQLLNEQQKTVFVTYLTVQPDKKNLKEFILELYNLTCNDNLNEVWVLGSKLKNEPTKGYPKAVRLFKNLTHFVDSI